MRERSSARFSGRCGTALLAERAGARVSRGGSGAGLCRLSRRTPLLWEHGVRVAAAASVAERADGGPNRRDGIDGRSRRRRRQRTLPVLRVIGQMGGIYVIAEGPEGMYLIDQHAAHERVLYERFWRLRQEGSPEVQGLLEPLSLEVSPRQRAMLGEQAELLREHGFDLEPFGQGAFVLRSVPRSLAVGADLREGVRRFLDMMLEEGEGDRRDRVAMSLACHGAIRAGKTLSLDEMRELVRLLEESEAPNTCPHGRPTMIHLSADDAGAGVRPALAIAQVSDVTCGLERRSYYSRFRSARLDVAAVTGIMLMTVGAGHLFEDQVFVPTFGRDGLDSGKTARESALSALPRFGECEGRVLGLPASVDLVVRALGRRYQAPSVEPGFESIGGVVHPAREVRVNILGLPRRGIWIMKRARWPRFQSGDERVPLVAVAAKHFRDGLRRS